MATTWKNISRNNWSTSSESDSDNAGEKTKIGSLQRIADACELMAKDRQKLISDYDYMRRDRDYYKSRCETLENKIRTMKGVITKMKKKPTTT